MRTIFAEYNPGRNSIDVYTSADYILVSPKEYSDHPLRSDLFFNHRPLIQILLQNANQFLNNDWLG